MNYTEAMKQAEVINSRLKESDFSSDILVVVESYNILCFRSALVIGIDEKWVVVCTKNKRFYAYNTEKVEVTEWRINEPGKDTLNPTPQEKLNHVQSERVRLGYENRDMRYLLKQIYCMMTYGDIIEESEGSDIKFVVINAVKDKLDELGEVI